MTEIRTERPAVLIGLGGTGKEALLGLRRMFLERYGVKTLPHIAQVVIDTDGRKRRLDGSEYDEFAREADFDEELVATPLNQILKNYRDNRPQYPHIDSWLDPALDSHGEITDGASQIRAFGRLAFFHHYHRIHDRIERAYRAVTDRTSVDASLEKFGIRMDPDFSGVETWIIFSVAGGTGSGMFLDTAFLARRIAQTYGGGEARSIILLPTAFSSAVPQHVSADSNHRVFANAYAALMEIETYNYHRKQGGDSRKQNQFRVQWTPELYRQNISESGPVFVNSWLIDNEPRDGGGQVHGERMALCQMISEWLFLQYGATAPELAGPIRSNRSNDSRDLVPLAEVRISHDDGQLGDEASEEDEVSLLFSRRYSSFGLSKIYVPTTNLAGQAYARLVRDLARLWLRPSKKGDIRRDALGRLNPRIYLPSLPEVNGFTGVLARRLSLDGTGNQLSRRLERLIQDQLAKLKGHGFEDGAEVEARDWFEAEIMLKLLDNSRASTARRGETSVRIAIDNVTEAMSEIRAALDKFLAETLATPGERIGYAEEALRLAVKDVLQLAREAGEKAEREERRGGRLQEELERLLTWAGTHHGFDRATLFEAAFSKMRDRAIAEFRRQVFLASVKLAEEVAEHIGTGKKIRDDDGKERTVDTGLLHALSVLRTAVRSLEDRAKERIFALRQQPASPLNSRAPAAESGEIEPDTELDNLYRDAEGAMITDEQLHDYEERLYVALAPKGFTSPWFLRDVAEAGGIEDSFHQLLEFASAQLAHLPGRMEDALLRFDQKFRGTDTKGQYDAELQRVISRGAPWLPKFEHNAGGNEAFRDVRGNSYVACSPRAAEGPRRALLDRVGSREVVAGPLDTVYFESEIAGLPLFAVRHIDAYRNAYLGHLNAADAATRVVHTEQDLEKFVDLLPFSSDEMQLRRRAIRAFARGVVSGVITLDDGDRPERKEWRFHESNKMSSRPVLRPLGRYRAAIRRLAPRDSALYSALAREVDAQFAQKLTYDDLARVYFALEEMVTKRPVDDSEWTATLRSILRDMRAQHGDDIVAQADLAGRTLESWGAEASIGSNHPFWQLKAYASHG